MPKASDLKRGQVVEIDQKLFICKDIDVRNPTSRGASTLYKVKFSGIPDGRKLEQTYKGEDMISDVELMRRNAMYSYLDGDMHVFMDNEDYSQYLLAANEIEGEMKYINESTEGIIILLVDGKVVSLEVPQVIVLQITETAPGIKGASASARTKPAVLSTGLEIQVPEYLEPGEMVKVNTETCKFMSRA